MTTEKKRPIDEARERLKILSLEVKDLVQEGMFFTINDAIMETLYRDSINREFKSYRQWRKEGFQVRKGEKAFLLWARPKNLEATGKKAEKEEPQTEDIEEMSNFFPLAYLFSNAQVDRIENPLNQNAYKPQVQTERDLEPLSYS